jgi:hypothetical protein
MKIKGATTAVITLENAEVVAMLLIDIQHRQILNQSMLKTLFTFKRLNTLLK